MTPALGSPFSRTRRANHAASSTVATIGAMTRTSAPVSLAAIASASSWASSSSGRSADSRSPRRPRAGFSSGPEVGERQRLVGAGIQGAHDDPAVAEGPEHLAVDLRLLLDGRRLVGREEDELGAEQPDALEVQRAGGLGVLDAADVGEQRHGVAVAGDARPAAGGERLGALLAAHPLRLDEREVGRDGDLAGVAVERHRRARRDAGGAGELDDRRDAHLRGEDRGVARAARRPG